MKRAPNGTKPKEGPFRVDIVSIANLQATSRWAGVDNMPQQSLSMRKREKI